MDESALKSLIHTLEASKGSFDVWLNAFSAMVALGVVVEIVFVVREYLDHLHDWRRGIVRPPDRPSRFWLAMELAGVALVSVGVAGEFWVDVQAGALETRIRKANGDLVLLVEQKANGAEKSAELADAAARSAEGAANDAGAKASNADGASSEGWHDQWEQVPPG